MASFIDDVNFLDGRVDWAILQNGWSSLYCKKDILDGDLAWFRDAGFSVVEINCADWGNTDNMHKALREKLSFPDYYGENLDALNDCLFDLEIIGEGLVVVLWNFDKTAESVRHPVADIFANNSRRHMLFGRKLILIMQVSSRNFNLPLVGGCPVLWNGAEFYITK